MNAAVATEQSPFSLSSLSLSLIPSAGLIGIDIGSRFTRLAQVRRHRGRWVISALQALPLTGEQPLDQPSLVNGAFAASLEQLAFREAGFRGRRCAAVLTGAIAEPRTLQLPAASPGETEQMARLELTDAPRDDTAADSLEFDLWTTPNAAFSDGTSRVSVISAPKNAAATVARDLQQQGLNCEVLDGLPFALARAVHFADPGSSTRTFATLDWGCHEPLLTVVQNGVPAFHRVFRDCGLEHAITAVRDEFTVSRFEACRLIAAVGVCRTDSSSPNIPTALSIRRAVDRCMQPVVERLFEQFRRSIAFLGQQHQRLVPESLWLFGGGAALSGIDAAFSSRFDLPCRSWQPATRQVTRELSVSGSLAPFGAAVGLSLMVEEL